MADQTVKISNLPDSGSPERVAYDLWNDLRALSNKKTADETFSDYAARRLALYAQCLNAAKGHPVKMPDIT